MTMLSCFKELNFVINGRIGTVDNLMISIEVKCIALFLLLNYWQLLKENTRYAQ